jgi:HEPN domain-containing protein
MKDETRAWLSYADENLEVARLALKYGHLNSSLQNTQQAVEKYLKSVIVEEGLEFRRTHSIRELVKLLSTKGISVNLADDEIDLMDTIYVPSKYPVYSALPDAMPDQEICEDALKIVEKLKNLISKILGLHM